jgi:CBS domain-containing protein
VTPTPAISAEVRERLRFISRSEPFKGLTPEELAKVAAAITEQAVAPGETVLVEGGKPGTALYMVHEGTMELLYDDVVVAIIASGDVFGHPTLLTGEAPEFTTRARSATRLYCIPKDLAISVLSRPDGLSFVSRTLRDRLIQAARTMSGVPDVRAQPVTSLVRSTPLFCGPDTTIHDAAEMMIAAKRSALLVETRDGLGIVTDVDLRNKVVVGGVSREAPVTAIMTIPVKTVSAEVLAPEASIQMMAAGVNHVPVVDQAGKVVGILSASSLMTLDARSPFALRRAVNAAADEEALVAASKDIPALFVSLMESNMDAPAVSRILTLLCDSIVMRLLELGIERHGEPPVAFAWMAFGSAARSEMTMASDQDNGLAYADTDDPAALEYLRVLALGVNGGLRRCGFPLDPHAVLAGNRDWRMSLSGWENEFRMCMEGDDVGRLARASVAFDFRQVAGELVAVPPLTAIIREAPQHRTFMRGIARLGTENPSPLGFRQKLAGLLDIKRDAIVPLQSLARYYAFSHGITAQTTLERLAAVRDVGGIGADEERLLREAYIAIGQMQMRHHAFKIRNGKPVDNTIDVSTLRPIDRVMVQEALREVASTQRRFPRLLR